MKQIVNIVRELEKTSAINEKIAILKKNSDNELFKRILIYTYDKDMKFGLSKKSIKLYDGISKWDNLFEMLDELANSNINNELRKQVGMYLNSLDDDIRDLVTKVLLKDLKVGIKIKSINKAIPNLLFDFAVMKADSYSNKELAFNRIAKKSGYMMMIKENGIRGEVFKSDNKVIFKTRQNKLIEGLVELEDAFKDMPNNMFFEGELLPFGDFNTSEEEFKAIDKIISTDGEKHGAYIKLFDFMPLENFNEKIYKVKAIDRKRMLKEFVRKANNKFIQFADIIYEGTDTDLIKTKVEEVSENSRKEGLMVLLNESPYECKRVPYLLKVKLWKFSDLLVTNVLESKENPNTMGSLEVDYKGNRVGVNGLTNEFKKYYWENPNEIIGKIVEIKYKSITYDKNGVPSLQFPSLSRIRLDKTVDDISYE